MKKFAVISTSVTVAALMAVLVIFPDRYIPVSWEGVKMWAVFVLPSLFPFFFLTLLLTKLGTLSGLAGAAGRFTEKHFRMSGVSVYVFVMSILSGYPVGAKLIAELHSAGAVDSDEATRMSCLASTSGPLFVAGTVGTGMFGSKTTGFLMLVCHITSAVICGKIFCKYGDFRKKPLAAAKPLDTDNVLYECIYSSVISILTVGGFICIFYLLSHILADFKVLSLPQKFLSLVLSFDPDCKVLSNGFVYGLIECTNGCRMLAASASRLAAPLACSLISFGGLSIIFQSLIYLNKAKVRTGIFLLSKTVQMALSFVLCLLCLYLADIF